MTPTFGVHPVGIAGLISEEIQFTNYSLDDSAAASVRDPVLTVIGSHEELLASSVEPKFDRRVGVRAVGIRTNDWSPLFYQMIHSTVPDPAAHDEVNAGHASR